MHCYPSAEEVTPLIVVGPPRSGTRFIANVLNQVPGITIHGEIPDYILQGLFRVIKRCDRIYPKNADKSRGLNWDASKRDFMFASWANLTKGKKIKVESQTRFFGYKTPFHERYFDFYNNFFYPVHPVYICCIRSFPEHLLSVQARWPKRVIAYVALRYVMSLRQLRYMKEKSSEHVLFFFLDEYKQTGSKYLKKKIFDPLELKEVAQAIGKAEQGPVNTSLQQGVSKKQDLNQIQKLTLRLFPKPLRDYEALRRDFG